MVHSNLRTNVSRSSDPVDEVIMRPAASRLALWLVGGTMAYNVVEAGVSLWSGERAESIALLGFGLDSIIECAAAAVMLWRLALEFRGADRERIEEGERKVRRFVGGTFVALTVYILGQSGWSLWKHEAPHASTVGIVLAIASLVIMPLISWGKLSVARKIRSAALRAEAKETLVCSYLSFTLLLGLGANAALGWWWADPVAALLMVPWIAKEGVEGLRGEEEEEENEDERDGDAEESNDGEVKQVGRGEGAP